MFSPVGRSVVLGREEGMEHEEKVTLGAAEVAARLHALADAVMDGRLTMGETTATVWPPIHFKQEYEEEHGRQELKVELTWVPQST
jgi:amphi-Trp domain-containing protein